MRSLGNIIFSYDIWNMLSFFLSLVFPLLSLQRLRDVPFLIRRLIRDLMDPQRSLPLVFRVRMIFAVKFLWLPEHYCFYSLLWMYFHIPFQWITTFIITEMKFLIDRYSSYIYLSNHWSLILFFFKLNQSFWFIEITSKDIMTYIFTATQPHIQKSKDCFLSYFLLLLLLPFFIFYLFFEW